MFLAGLTIVLLTGYAALFLYYRKGWNRLSGYTSSVKENKVFVSVIIAARNEERSLPDLLERLSRQTFQGEFEVIVANDHSDDNTAAITKNYPLVKLINLAENEGGKKTAITKAIHAASGELLMITDADCLPGEEWLQTVVDFYTSSGSVFIAAPVAYTTNNTLLSVFQTTDFITLQGITAAGVATGFHSMCNGANLAYTKTAFNAVNGFKGIDKIASGDDLLLMHKIAKKFPGKVNYLKSEKAIVQTTPPQTWKEFYWQRIRWAGKTVHYEDKKIFYALLLVLLVNILFFVLLVVSFVNPFYWWILAGYLIIKTIVELIFVYPVARFYQQEKLLWYFPCLQPLHITYVVLIGLLSQSGSYYWKGRRTK